MAYGGGLYGGGLYGSGGAGTPLHYFALQQLNPIKNLEGQYLPETAIEGQYLDDAYFQAQEELTEFFPDTSTLLLGSWLRIFGLTTTGDPIQDQAALVAKERVIIDKSGRLTIAYYLSVATALGHPEAFIIEGSTQMFILAVSPFQSVLGDSVYNQEHIWYWELHASVVPGDRGLWEATFNALKPGFTQLAFIYF